MSRLACLNDKTKYYSQILKKCVKCPEKSVFNEDNSSPSICKCIDPSHRIGIADDNSLVCKPIEKTNIFP
ncbi:MAG: hypothetical protein MHPSP_001514, partial [Paramarteilia canceri]